MTREGAAAAAWASARIAVAVLIVGAVVAQAIVTIGSAAAEGRDVTTTLANFFCYFTILSNIGAVVALLWGGIWLARSPRGVESRALALTLASVATYLVVTGVVYNALLRFLPATGQTVPWSNEVLHVVAPLFLIVDVFFAPGRRALSWHAVWVVLVYPLTWIVYTLGRAPFVRNPLSEAPYWYPYPFLDPNTGFGWLPVAAYVVGIAVVIALTAAGVIAVGRRRGSRAPAASAPQRHAASPAVGVAAGLHATPAGGVGTAE